MNLPKYQRFCAANGFETYVGHWPGAYIPGYLYVTSARKEGSRSIQCGSDEHGTAIPIPGYERNCSRKFIDKYHCGMKQGFWRPGYRSDIYHRTSERNCITCETSQEFYLNDHGRAGNKETEQYCQFRTEKHSWRITFYKGICPNCGSDRAFNLINVWKLWLHTGRTNWSTRSAH